MLEDLTQHQVFRDWVIAITKQANERSLLFGIGSPEDVKEARKGREYMDETGTAGNIKYIKQVNDVAGDTKKGWILV